MRRNTLITVAVLCLLTAVTAFGAGEWSTIEALVGRSVKRVEIIDGESKGYCSAGIINQKKGYVLTAAHCVPKEKADGMLTVDRRDARVKKVNWLLDLAVLTAEDLKGPELQICPGDTEIGQPVSVVGYAFAGLRLKYTFGHVSDIGDESLLPGMFLDTTVIPGHSGGVAVTPDGCIIGVVQSNLISSHGTGLGIVSSQDSLRSFVKEYLPEKPATASK